MRRRMISSITAVRVTMGHDIFRPSGMRIEDREAALAGEAPGVRIAKMASGRSLSIAR